MFNIDKIIKIAKALSFTFKDFEICILFGKMPMEVKRKVVDNFNNATKSILISTDAIGLGVNLNIKRVIFCTLIKSKIPLSLSNIAQIAGRAGRNLSKGLVSYMNIDDKFKIAQALIKYEELSIFYFPKDNKLLELMCNSHYSNNAINWSKILKKSFNKLKPGLYEKG